VYQRTKQESLRNQNRLREKKKSKLVKSPLKGGFGEPKSSVGWRKKPNRITTFRDLIFNKFEMRNERFK
jgi:hypothetical protein